MSERPTNLGRTVAVDLAGPGGAEILRAAVVSYRHFFNQFFSKPKPMLSCLWPPEKGRAAEGSRQGRSGRRNENGKAFEASGTQPETRVVRAAKNFVFFARNPLKSPESAKEIQGNPSIFPWNSLVFLGFIWRELARWLNPGPAAALVATAAPRKPKWIDRNNVAASGRRN